MKKFLLFSLILMVNGQWSMVNAQNWQSTTDKMWGNYCYREKNGRWLDALTTQGGMTSMPATENIRLAYYWRIPKGKVRADIVWTNAFARFASLNIVLTYPETGDTLAVNSVSNDVIQSVTRTDDLFGKVIDFPADDFYRVEISSPKWSYIKNIQYFSFQRESTDPVMIPRNFGGTSAHMFGFRSTDPDAPSGGAYDWGYVECMAPSEYLCPGTYFMTMGPLNGYMGMQTSSVYGDNDFNKSVLFSVWDNGNTDEDPNLSLYLQSRVMDGNSDAVHTHAGGEGSSASIMFKDKPHWWRQDHWIQFLLNTRPETVTVTVKDSKGQDSTFFYDNILMSTWYKVDTMPEWRYMATIRSSGQSDLLSSWYCFIEPFTSYAGNKLHRVFYRNAMGRAANSGRWYSRNRVDLVNDTYPRDFHYDFGRGASQEHAGAFFLDMGAYIHQHDSAAVIPLVTDKTCVDTIDTDRLMRRVEEAVMRDSKLDKNWALNLTADPIPSSTWTIIADQSYKTNVYGKLTDLFDDNDGTHCSSDKGSPYKLSLKADDEQTVTSFDIYWAHKYSWRTKYADIYTSTDGQEWTLAFDSLLIRCEDYTKVSFPRPVKTQYLQVRFYQGYDSNGLSINTLTFRGAYNLDKVKAIAKEQIDNAGTFTYFPDAALKTVKSVYNDGRCTNADLLAAALRALYNGTQPLNYSRLHYVRHISPQRAYNLQNMSGYGTLTATADKKLTTRSATAAGTLTAFAGQQDVTDPLANWVILHDERYSGYYLYNIGAERFLNLSADGFLSTQPQSFSMRASGKGFYFTAGSEAIGVNSTDAAGAVKTTGGSAYSLFYVYDNYGLNQPVTLRDSLTAIVEPLGKAALYMHNIQQMINAPVGVVGGFTSEEARADLQAAYEKADTNPQAFINAVENADIIAFDPDHSVYKLRSAYDGLSATPYLTSDPGQRLYCKAEAKVAEQIFRFQTRGYGYSIHSQGQSLRPTEGTSGYAIATTTDPSQRGTYILEEKEWANFLIGPAQNTNAMICGNYSPVKTAAMNADGTRWYLEPCTTSSVSLNSTGTGAIYADYAVQIPEGVQAFVANHVSPEGVIKLTEIHGVVPPATPIIIRGESYQKVELPVLNVTDSEAAVFRSQYANIFQGVFTRTTNMTKGTFFTLTNADGKPVMKRPALSLVSANSIYIPFEEGMPDLQTYVFDFDDLVDGINPQPVNAQSSMLNGQWYDLQGRKVVNTVKGNIYINNRKKIREK
ncbi:MAG: DUF3472 domain-containing protein [Bacteroidaceae bacterium]|nr:DUF3472 domain-containing protein [Bacteroidaceae bacterium]